MTTFLQTHTLALLDIAFRALGFRVHISSGPDIQAQVRRLVLVGSQRCHVATIQAVAKKSSHKIDFQLMKHSLKTLTNCEM